ncbi:MAG TPA: GGDEF domain-containing protein [Mesorhizobium sp.]|jgi:diguanylate cyclase (GGDEF)-like protein
MTGALFILAINMAVAGLLAAAFMTIAVYDVRRVSARWMAAAYLLGMFYFAIEFAIPAFSDAIPVVVVAFVVLLAGTLAFNIAIAHKYDVAPPWRWLLGLLIAAAVLVSQVQDLPRQSLLRMGAYQIPYALMVLFAAGIVWRSPLRRQRLDYVLIALICASAAQFAAKPFVAQALGGWGANPQAYSRSIYASVSQAAGSVFLVAIALLLLVMIVRDVLADATAKSETDALSGLMNRRGFEDRALDALRSAVRHGVPLSLVIADLDNFKNVNDGFGHASGDRAIQAFASLLRGAVSGAHVAGRIGGEEFAILLPGSNLAAARLLAEGTRSAFSAVPIAGLPADYRCTASFGVAQLGEGEEFGALMRRADHALYQAKRTGRDRVCVMPMPDASPARTAPVAQFNGKG